MATQQFWKKHGSAFSEFPAFVFGQQWRFFEVHSTAHLAKENH
jgi:hypothetical protein